MKKFDTLEKFPAKIIFFMELSCSESFMKHMILVGNFSRVSSFFMKFPENSHFRLPYGEPQIQTPENT
jgi:hypothetical protein